MLVCSGLEINIVALQSLITRDRICEHDLIRISDMRLAGCVGNRGCHIKFSLVTHFVCSFLIKQKNPVFGADIATRRRDSSRGTTSIHTEPALCASADIELIAVLSNVQCSVLPLQSHLPSALPHFLAASCNRAAGNLSVKYLQMYSLFPRVCVYRLF